MFDTLPLNVGVCESEILGLGDKELDSLPLEEGVEEGVTLSLREAERDML